MFLQLLSVPAATLESAIKTIFLRLIYHFDV